ARGRVVEPVYVGAPVRVVLARCAYEQPLVQVRVPGEALGHELDLGERHALADVVGRWLRRLDVGVYELHVVARAVPRPPRFGVGEVRGAHHAHAWLLEAATCGAGVYKRVVVPTAGHDPAWLEDAARADIGRVLVGHRGDQVVRGRRVGVRGALVS